MKRLFFIGVLVMAFLVHTQNIFAASSCLQSSDQIGDLKIVELSWTAHTDGTFTSVLTTWRIDGLIVCVDTDPGSTAPTANYDITLTNDFTIDVMGGALENRHTTTSERTQPIINGGYKSVLSYGRLTLNISNNAVNGATGKVRIYYYSD